MNILIAADYQSPYGGNFLGSFLDLATSLADRGDRVMFLFPLREQGERSWISFIKNAGNEVFLLDMSMENGARLQKIAELIQTYNIDLVHSNFGMLYHDFLFNKKVFGKANLIFHDHMGFDMNYSLEKQKVKNLLRALLYLKNQIGVISVMREKDHSYFADIGKHWFVPNGISFRRCLSESLTRDEQRTRMGISEETKLVLAFGWSFSIKGIDTAVQSVEIARREDPSIQLAVVIQTETLSDAERNELIQKTGIDPEQTPWLHFWPASEDVFSYHRAADLFLSSSRTESFSFAILEAISQKRPVLMSDIEGTKWAEQYSKCKSFHVGDPIDCAKKLLEMIRFDQTMKDNSNEILETYSIDKWIKKILSVYDSMMKV